MRRCGARYSWICAGLVLCTPLTGIAQDRGDTFAGLLAGVSALSADTSAATSLTTQQFQLSTYSPQNGAALNVFVGTHLSDYATVQANYLWNRNGLEFTSAVGTSGASSFDEVLTASSQHGVVGDVLVFFRNRSSRIRPYLSGGVGIFRLSSTTLRDETPTIFLVGDGTFTSVTPVLRVAVGIDVSLNPTWSLRYSFSEGISANPVGTRLEPSGERVLMNFQNLVGLMVTF